jgi:hypothetical protein
VCRVGTGIWRRGAETPNPVKWDERISELRKVTGLTLEGAPWVMHLVCVGKLSNHKRSQNCISINEESSHN